MSAETQLASEVIYRAKPLIEVDGQGDAMVQRLLTAMCMSESEGGMSSLELRFNNSAHLERRGVDFAFEYSDNDMLSLGNEIKVKCGDENEPLEIFRGRITGLELVVEERAQPELVVLAEDVLQTARMQRHTRVFNEVSVADIVERLAGELGLTPVVHELDRTLLVEAQYNESNLAFLRRLLERHDSDVQVVADELHVSARGEVRRNEITLELNSQLTSVRLLADLSQQVTEVTYSGWDVAQGREITASQDASVNAGPGQGSPGSRVLGDTLGDRSEHIGNAAVIDEREAQALVDSCFARRERGFVTVQGCAVGHPQLRVGTHVTIHGVGPRFNNSYYVCGACHRYDEEEGYRTEFRGECAYFGV